MSQRGISSRPRGKNPAATPSTQGASSRENVASVTDATPSTPCAAAIRWLAYTVSPKVKLAALSSPPGPVKRAISAA